MRGRATAVALVLLPVAAAVLAALATEECHTDYSSLLQGQVFVSEGELSPLGERRQRAGADAVGEQAHSTAGLNDGALEQQKAHDATGLNDRPPVQKEAPPAKARETAGLNHKPVQEATEVAKMPAAAAAKRAAAEATPVAAASPSRPKAAAPSASGGNGAPTAPASALSQGQSLAAALTVTAAPQATTTQLFARDDQRAPSLWVSMTMFIGMGIVVLFAMLLVLGCLQCVVYGQRSWQDWRLSNEPAKPLARRGSMQFGKGEAPIAPVGRVDEHDVGAAVQGDSHRLEALLQLAAAPRAEALARSLVQRGSQATKLTLSPASEEQVCAGILALAKAAGEMSRRATGEPFNARQKLQSTMHQVLSMVRICRALRLPPKHDHEERAWTTHEAHASYHTDRYSHGHKDTMQRQSRHAASESPVVAYFSGDRWLDHMAVGFVFLYSQCCAVVYAAYLRFRFPDMYDFFGPWLLLSRGEAMAITVLTVLMVLLLSRGLMTIVRDYVRWSAVLETIVDKYVLIHKSCGVMLVICSALHILGHFMGSIPAIIAEHDDAKINAAFTYGTKIMYNFNSWGEAFRCYPAVTGYVLILLLLAFWTLSNERVRQWNFELFHYPHLLLIVLWFVALSAHGARQWLGVGVPLGTLAVFPTVAGYMLERALHIWKAMHPTIRIANATLKRRTVLLEIDTGTSGFACETGMYCMLKVPAISDYQWHPFTIASGGGGRFSVLFAVVGDWTRQLADLVGAAQKSGGAYPTICVRGGYGAPAEGMKDKKHIVMVGAGIGATPFLSFLSNVCTSAQNRLPSQFDGVESAVFYWVSREPEDFVWVNQYASTIANDARLRDRISLRLCLTRSLDTTATEDCSATEVALFWHGVHIALSKLRAADLASELGAPTQFGRPDWHVEFMGLAEELMKKQKAGDPRLELSVYVCGNQMLVGSLQEACNSAAAALGQRADFRLYAEQF